MDVFHSAYVIPALAVHLNVTLDKIFILKLKVKVKYFQMKKRKKTRLHISAFPLLSGDVPGSSCPRVFEWAKSGGSSGGHAEDSGGETVRKREVVFNRTTERWREHWKCTQIKLTS